MDSWNGRELIISFHSFYFEDRTWMQEGNTHTVVLQWSLPANAANSVMNTRSYLSEEYAELFERLQQTGISNLLDDKDTFGWLVPC